MDSREPRGSLPKKSLGQHWLHDDASLTAMCDAAAVAAGDTVLEIGPGLGTLTAELLQRGAHVTAVEYDANLAANLEKDLLQHKNSSQELLEVVPLKEQKDGVIGNLSVLNEDILRFDFASLPPDYKIVANIPYYLTSNLIRVISETPNRPSVAAMLVQKEVAQRVVAAPGDMSVLSVTAQLYWQVGVGPVVPARLFTPPPKVDSQVLLLERPGQARFPGVDTQAFFRLVKSGFSERRKKLRSSLSGGLHLSKPDAERLLQAAGIDPNLRAQALSLDDWHKLYQAFDAVARRPSPNT
ncbi:MAG TPA: 16S rRNA (adenine(1518)-N(6)/adenine(1519)-N(6))-dimethyltransferase RsmA [Candidatus Saccharimonadales bacterium]